MIAIAGSKGGCGKSTITLGLAEAFARADTPVLAIDADRQLPNLHVMTETDREPTLATLVERAFESETIDIREHRPITVELHDGTELELGTNEPIEFESTTEVIVVMPGGIVSSGGVPTVGDTEPEHGGQTVCSPTWDQTGPGFDPAEAETTIERECAYPISGSQS